MSILASKKIELYGRKILCVDDDIAPSEDERGGFLHSSCLKEEDVIFTSAYSSALKLIEEDSAIGLAIIDIRIPKNPGDLESFNPENPEKDWGIELLERANKIDYEKKFAISAYPQNTLSEHKIELLAADFYKKPINHKVLRKNIEYIAIKYWKKQFDYSILDNKTSSFLQEKAQNIQRLVKRSKEDIFNIGSSLIEVKEKLGHGNFLKWIRAEFGWTDRTANRFMSVAKRFDIDTVSDLEILPSALYLLAAPSTPLIAVSEAFELAEEGEVITKKTAVEVISKYKNSEEKATKNTEIGIKAKVKSNDKNKLIDKKTKKTTQQNNIEKTRKKENSTTLTIQSLNEKEQPKQAILKVISTTKLTQDTWWQLGENHRLFCGEPKAYDFFKKIPSDIALVVNYPPNNDYSTIPFIKSSLEFSIRSGYGDVDLDSLANGIEEFLAKTTNPKDTVVFCYLFNVKLLEIAANRGCHCIVAEPDLENCNKILAHWRSKESVKRILPSQ